MAQYQAIATIGNAIIRLLKNSRPEEFKQTFCTLYQVNDFSATPNGEGVSLYLYRIGLNAARRNLPTRTGLDGRRYRAPLPVDLYYLLTTWGKVERQHRLLGWAMRVLEDTPLLASGLLNDIGPEPEIFFPNETVELVFDPLSLQDMYNIWSTMRVSPQLSASYVVRAVALDSLVPLTEAAPVQTRALDYRNLVA